MNLYVKAPDGHVHISVPTQTSDRAVRAFVCAHLEWIKTQQKRMYRVHVPRRMETGEIVRVFGVPHTLLVKESAQKKSCGVQQVTPQLILTAPVGSVVAQREQSLQYWQRMQLRRVAAMLLQQWTPVLDVCVAEWHIKRMKTRWGSCNYHAHRIWLSLSLAEQPLDCVEYVVVHELCHLLEPSHNERFWKLMTEFLPDWQQRRASLNARSKEPK